jgi:hypothetical protein
MVGKECDIRELENTLVGICDELSILKEFFLELCEEYYGFIDAQSFQK